MQGVTEHSFCQDHMAADGVTFRQNYQIDNVARFSLNTADHHHVLPVLEKKSQNKEFYSIELLFSKFPSEKLKTVFVSFFLFLMFLTQAVA